MGSVIFSEVEVQVDFLPGAETQLTPESQGASSN